MAFDAIDVVFLAFAAVTLFFTFLFLVLYAKNRRSIYLIPPLTRLPSVSIIIPAFNEAKAIADTIRAVKRLDYPKRLLEIIVIDDGSTDNTYKIAKGFSGVRVLKKKNQGKKAYAFNYGLNAARGEIVGCLDADSYPEPDSLKKAVRFFGDSDVAAVTTSVFVKNPKNFLEALQKVEYVLIVWSRKLLEFINSVYVTPGALSLYRKKVIKKLGGFDVKNMTEDIEIAWRLLYSGYKIKMSAGSEVYTQVPRTFRDWWKQRLRWNIGGIETTMKYKHAFFNRKYGMFGGFIVPFFTLSYVVSLLGLSLFVYLALKWAYEALSFTVRAHLIGADPTRFLGYLMLPNVFTVFGIIIFSLSMLWIVISHQTVRKNITSVKDVASFIIYLTFYITLFPFLLIQSVWRYLTKKKEW